MRTEKQEKKSQEKPSAPDLPKTKLGLEDATHEHGHTKIPEGLRVRQAKFKSLLNVAFMHTLSLSDKDERQQISMTMAGPLLWIERIIPNDTGVDARRGVWAVPVTSIEYLAFPQERVEVPKTAA